MTIEYKIEKTDFSSHQLYTASKSEAIKYEIKKVRIRLPIVYLILGLLLFFFADIIFAIIFISIGIAWYIFSPYYLKNKYLRHYEKHIDENFKNRIGKTEQLSIRDDYIESISHLGESKTKITEIEEVNEIKDYFFIKLSSGDSFILPKANINSFSDHILKMISEFNIKHNVELDWKWK